MNLDALERLAKLKKNGVITKKEFETEKEKLLKQGIDDNTPLDVQENSNMTLTDSWEDYAPKIFIVTVILCFVVFLVLNLDEMNLFSFIFYCMLASLIGYFFKEHQRMSKNINDLHRYNNINDILVKYGTPDDIKKYNGYVKYTFKKSTNGWGCHKYKVDIFTLKNKTLIKHERYHE